MSGFDDLIVRRGGYVPTFEPAPAGPGNALLRTAGHQLDALRERLSQAPDKRGFALLDLVGVGLVPATAARAPVVFLASPGLDHVTAPAGTRLGATVAGRSSPLVFETESAVAIAAARLVEVASVVPGRDAYTSHVSVLGAGGTATLFDASTPFVHELYLAHDTLLALAGRSIVDLVLSLRNPATEPLALEAAWWDGRLWRSFAPFADPAGDEDSIDGTAGLTRGGTIRLFSPCADARKATVFGTESSWIRLRVASPLASPRMPGATLPDIERVRVRTVVERRRVAQRIGPSAGTSRVTLWAPDGRPVAGAAVRLRDVTTPHQASNLTTDGTGSANLSVVAGGTYQLAVGASPGAADWLPPFTAAGVPSRVDLVLQHGMLPDKAMSDGRVVDATKSFTPLGPNPDPGSALYLAFDEVSARPGAEVAIELGRPRTAQEEADEQGAVYEIQINAAVTLVRGIENTLSSIAAALDALRIAKDANGIDVAAGPIGAPLPGLVSEPTTVWYDRLKKNITTLVKIAGTAATDQIDDLLDLIGDIVGGLFGGNAEKEREAQRLAALSTLAIAEALEALGVTAPALVTNRVLLQSALNAPGGIDFTLLNVARNALRAAIADVVAHPETFISGTFPPFLTMRPEDFVGLVAGRLAQATAALLTAASRIRAVVDLLVDFDPANLVAANGGLAPSLSPAVVAWEYWDGGRWAPLPGLGAPQAGATAANFHTPGVVRFTVPEDWANVDVAGDSRRWLRARLASGHYSRLRLVAWTDAESKRVNFLPVIEPRPPVIDRIEATYRSATELTAPERAISFDDAEWRDHTSQLEWPGPTFAPFRWCRDSAPALYLGYESPLPAEAIGVFFDVEERPGAKPTVLRFEAWDGTSFRQVEATDGTRGLTGSGIVSLLWPGDGGSVPSLVVRAVDTTVLLGEPGAALRYPPGTSVWLADARGGELTEVAASSEDELTVSRPLSRAYAGAFIRPAPPARFGRPLTWLRVVLEAGAEAPRVRVRAVTPNAVWASNIETFAGEVLGGSDGSPGQVFFLRRTPALAGEIVEVRELTGPRAAVDAPILAEELGTEGRAGDLRLERDASTGRVTAAWVRWRGCDTLAFSDGVARNYVMDRVGGRVLFGDGRSGRVPPAGADNVSITYRAGGDPGANVPAGGISSVLSGVLARGVVNPLPARGGANGERLGSLRERGPGVLRHRHQALTADDYAALALEASSSVARASGLGAVDDVGRPMAGRVRVVIVPTGEDPAPTPSLELRRLVAQRIAARSPLTVTGSPSITVTGPRYAIIGVDLTVRPVDPDGASEVRDAVAARTLSFLHPLSGGDGGGFSFGARVASSDLARAVARLPGVDAIVALAFLVDGIPQGETLQLAPDRLPTAGVVRVLLTEVS